MSRYRTLEEVTEEYLRNYPEEIDDFLSESFAEYANDGDSIVLLSQLRIIARVKGISEISQEIGITCQGLQKALSEKKKVILV